MTIKLRAEDIGYINAFEIVTKARVVDFISTEEVLYFVAEGKTLPQILGKENENIRKLQGKLDKRIRVYKNSADVERFTAGLVGRGLIGVERSRGGRVVKISVEREAKPLVIGRGGHNLEIIKELLRRRFGIEDVVVK